MLGARIRAETPHNRLDRLNRLVMTSCLFRDRRRSVRSFLSNHYAPIIYHARHALNSLVI